MSETTTQTKIKMSTRQRTRALTEAALMLALGTVLQFIPLVKMPFGGDVTAFCMLPVIIIAYRYGCKFGFLVGFVYSLIQLLLGMNNLQYGTSFTAVVIILLFDYILAYSSIGLAGIFKNSKLSQGKALAYGSLIVCAVRLICHIISGCTVWAIWAPEGMPVIEYSVLYNSAYMIPEAIITAAVGVWISSFIDFRNPTLAVHVRKESTGGASAVIFKTVSSLFAIAAVVIDTLHIFSTVQSEEGFNLALISNVNPLLLVITTLIGAAGCVLFYLIYKKTASKNG